MTAKLTGRRALVTGASRGIGAAIAVALAGEGAEVAVGYGASPDKAGEVVARGRSLYAHNCLACHGFAAKSSGLYPDLRFSSPEVHGLWNAIVLGGLRADGGMAGFADGLSVEDAQAIRAYVLERAWHEPGFFERALTWVVGAGGCLPTSWLTD